jgi:pimeloyl-ACP methyl ester carboxylesterase
MGITVVVLAAIAIALAGLLVMWSSGKVRPVLNMDGRSFADGIAEKAYVNVNGTQQGMFLRSADTSHPVLLYLHGGPAMPTYFLERSYPTGLEADFTVCWWEQRGAGLSYSADIPPETMTVEQIIVDTLAVTDYLRDRFGQDKIYLMGHSWGSFIGIQVAARSPERFHAYIGVGQMSNQLASEREACEYMLSEFAAQGNTKMIQKLQAASFEMKVPLPKAYMRLRDAAMHQLGIGTTRQMRSVISGVFVPVWRNREYTLRERANIWRGKWSGCSRRLWNEMLATDVGVQIPKLGIPAYFLHGKYDYTVSYSQAREYLHRLEAPAKGFYTYGESAHSPIFEEPERTRTILNRDVLSGVTNLCDIG